MEKLWKTVNLSKVYKVKTTGGWEDFYALNNINLDINRGETFGVIGESGSGKTTLGKVLIKLIEPDTGDIFYRHENIAYLKEKRLRRLRKNFQIIFQDPYKSLNPRISAGKTVMEGIRGKTTKQRKQKAEELMEITGIKKGKFNAFPHQFSGGEKQRISIARALSTDPEFIVCDEPTSNLDLSIQAQILNLFLKLRETFNLTYLFISHDLKVIELVADSITVMYAGEIVETGTNEQIMKTAAHPYTKLLLSSSFFKKMKTEEKNTTGKCNFFSRCPYGTEKCKKEKPVLKEIEKGHFAACHLL
jgi:oligopeptide/dipeptide ABC transporter ATP-binding protein